MLKLCARAMALAALGIIALAPKPSQAASAYDHPAHPNYSDSSQYVLTPLEQKRLRTYGLKDQEIYLLANAASVSTYDIDSVVALYLGAYNRGDVYKYMRVDPNTLTKMKPEWGTPEWQAAVERGDYTFIQPQTYMGPRPPKM
jgi:hypothetical protein